MPSYSVAVERTTWSAPALAGGHDQILDHLERNAPVRLIATIGEFVHALPDEPLAEAGARAEAGRFDFLPVRKSQHGPVIGLLRRADAFAQPDRMAVRDAMEPLTGDNLISADAPLLDFVYSADTHPCRLVLDRSEIRGLVTLSDLQRLPVRTALFGLFIHLELLMTEVIRRKTNGAGVPFDLLSHDRAEDVRERWAKMQSVGMDRDPFEPLAFADKKTIAKKIKLFGLSGETIRKELQAIEQDLRDPLAHGLTIAAAPEEARRLVLAARLVRNWIAHSRRELASMSAPNGTPD